MFSSEKCSEMGVNIVINSLKDVTETDARSTKDTQTIPEPLSQKGMS